MSTTTLLVDITRFDSTDIEGIFDQYVETISVDVEDGYEADTLLQLEQEGYNWGYIPTVIGVQTPDGEITTW